VRILWIWMIFPGNPSKAIEPVWSKMTIFHRTRLGNTLFYCVIVIYCILHAVTIDHFARCKQHWFLTLHKSWDKIQPTEHLKLNQKVKKTSSRFFLYMWNKENSYKLKQEVFLGQCFLHLAKWSIVITINNMQFTLNQTPIITLWLFIFIN